ncbi:MAG: hypothetical protein WCP03_00920 [Candidatus Saccharibacteria bacterium]
MVAALFIGSGKMLIIFAVLFVVVVIHAQLPLVSFAQDMSVSAVW